MYTSAKPYFYGTGRRKKSVARVRLYPGTGVFTINGKTADEYFGLDTLKLIINKHFGVTETTGKSPPSAAAASPGRQARSVTASPVRSSSPTKPTSPCSRRQVS